MTSTQKYKVGFEGFTPRRLRLVVSNALYGGAIGGAALPINLLARTDFPQVPQHMPLQATLILSGGAAIACGVVAGLMTLWMTGPQQRETARGLFVWLLAGFGFGVLSPVFTGAVLPMGTLILGVIHKDIEASDIFIHAITAILQAPPFAFTHGVFGLFTGFVAGALFGVGAWLIDKATHTSIRTVSVYGPYAIASLLGLLFYGIAVFGPPETLARFG